MSTQPPPLAQQAVSFAKALVKEGTAIIAGQEPVTPDEYTRRINLCYECPNFSEGQCLICGCPMERKASFRTSSCAAQPPKW